jgi:hypothetical protein
MGWHRDAPPFGIIAAISLASKCPKRFQNGVGSSRETAEIELPPRFLYLSTGIAGASGNTASAKTRNCAIPFTFRTLNKTADKTC